MTLKEIFPFGAEQRVFIKWREEGWRYGVAVMAAVVALLIRLGLDRWVGDYQPWVTLYLAVLLVGWQVGWGPALVTALLGLGGGLWLLIPPRHSFGLHHVQHGVQVLTYCAVATALVLLMRVVRRQQDRLRAAIEASRRQEQEYRASFELALMGEAQIDPATGRFLRINEALSRMTGYTSEELLEKTVTDLTYPQEREAEWLKFERVACGEQSGYASETRFVRRDGLPIWVRASVNLARCPAGNPWRIMAVIEDVTARKQAAAALESEKALSRAVVETLPGLFYLLDEQFRLRRWNKNFEKVSGYSAEEISQMTALDLVAPECRELAEEKIREAFTKGAAEAELYSLTKDGRRLPYACTSRRLQRENQNRVIGLGVDISEQKRAEEALERQNRRLKLLNEAAAYLLSSDDSEEVLSRLYERIARFSHAGIFLAFRANEAAEVLELESCGGVTTEARSGLAQVKFGQGICGTVAQQRRPLVVSHIQQSSNPLADLAKGLGLRVYACSPLLAGDRLLGTLAFASGQRDEFEPEDVEFFQILASYVAIAKERVRLQNELRQHAQNLEQTVDERTARLREMMGELEHFSYSIVHDMRAPLRSILGFAEMLVPECGRNLTEKGNDYLRRLREAVSRMDLLITDALQYSWVVRSELPLAPVDTARLLRGILESYPQFQEAQADIRLEGDFPPVLANAAGLTQCFSNLLGNAVKFVRPGQRPQVRIWAERKWREPGAGSPAPPDAGQQLQPGARGSAGQPLSPVTPHGSPLSVVRLYIEDQGIGIPPEAQARVFDMFQRMHSTAYEGTGIGLALVRKVVQRMDGSVGLDSEPGKGSRFWLELRSTE